MSKFYSLRLGWGTALLIACSPAAWAGHATGNGGDTYAQEFVEIGADLAKQLALNPLPGVDALLLSAQVKKTEVHSKETLELRGYAIDAINYPDVAAPLIELNRKAWDRIGLRQHRKAALVLHEYLGLMGVDDSHYQISGTLDRMGICARLPDIRSALERIVGKPCFAFTAGDLSYAEAELGKGGTTPPTLKLQGEESSDSPFNWGSYENERIHVLLLHPVPAKCGESLGSALADREWDALNKNFAVSDVKIDRNQVLLTMITPDLERITWKLVFALEKITDPESCEPRSRIEIFNETMSPVDGETNVLRQAFRLSTVYWSASFWNRVRANAASPSPANVARDFVLAYWNALRPHGLMIDPRDLNQVSRLYEEFISAIANPEIGEWAPLKNVQSPEGLFEHVVGSTYEVWTDSSPVDWNRVENDFLKLMRERRYQAAIFSYFHRRFPKSEKVALALLDIMTTPEYQNDSLNWYMDFRYLNDICEFHPTVPASFIAKLKELAGSSNEKTRSGAQNMLNECRSQEVRP